VQWPPVQAISNVGGMVAVGQFCLILALQPMVLCPSVAMAIA